MHFERILESVTTASLYNKSEQDYVSQPLISKVHSNANNLKAFAIRRKIPSLCFSIYGFVSAVSGRFGSVVLAVSIVLSRWSRFSVHTYPEYENFGL